MSQITVLQAEATFPRPMFLNSLELRAAALFKTCEKWLTNPASGYREILHACEDFVRIAAAIELPLPDIPADLQGRLEAAMGWAERGRMFAAFCRDDPLPLPGPEPLHNLEAVRACAWWAATSLDAMADIYPELREPVAWRLRYPLGRVAMAAKHFQIDFEPVSSALRKNLDGMAEAVGVLRQVAIAAEMALAGHQSEPRPDSAVEDAQPDGPPTGYFPRKHFPDTLTADTLTVDTLRHAARDNRIAGSQNPANNRWFYCEADVRRTWPEYFVRQTPMTEAATARTATRRKAETFAAKSGKTLKSA